MDSFLNENKKIVSSSEVLFEKNVKAQILAKFYSFESI